MDFEMVGQGDGWQYNDKSSKVNDCGNDLIVTPFIGLDNQLMVKQLWYYGQNETTRKYVLWPVQFKIVASTYSTGTNLRDYETGIQDI